MNMPAGGGADGAANFARFMDYMNRQSGGGEEGSQQQNIFDEIMNTLAERLPALKTYIAGIPHTANFEQASIIKKLELPSNLFDAKINPGAGTMNAKGGFLASLFALIISNKEITNNAQLHAEVGIGGEGSAGGDAGGDAGGGGDAMPVGSNPYGDGAFVFSASENGVEPVAFFPNYNMPQAYNMASASESQLGELTPPSTPSMGRNEELGVG